MTIRPNPLTIPVVEVSKLGEKEAIYRALAATLGVGSEGILGYNIVKKSLDARRKANIVHHYQLDVEVDREDLLLKKRSDLKVSPVAKKATIFDGIKMGQKLRHKPLIIGSGPAGSFCALTLNTLGVPCTIMERGEAIGPRTRTVNKLRRNGTFDPESHYCYGEGGAGTFSDGKLTCGRNHPLIRHVFETFVKHGAPKDILYESHPHMGTDYLLRIAYNMRKSLEKSGSEYHFKEKMVSFRDGKKEAKYLVKFASGLEIPTDHLILAIGHSARDTYQSLLDHGVAIAQKPFAIGARLEHPQEDINKIQLGSCQLLGAAEYKLRSQQKGRGIWTFCMCPGGHLLPTSAKEGHLAINGMSYHARKSHFANAAVVVNIRREDFDNGHPLDGMRFQENLEKEAFKAGGGGYHSPAQRLTDFLKGRLSKGHMNTTYKPGVQPARMDKLLPDYVVESLKAAMGDYQNKMRGYISDRALVVGLESKTSSPIVMPRDKNLQSVSHKNLFPCGEGAGHAGGIISAALDGVKVGRALLASMELKEEKSLLNS